MKKKKKYYQTLSRFVGYSFLIIGIIPALISIVGLIINDDSIKQYFYITIFLFPFVGILLYLGYYWVEIDKNGIHSKNLFGNICTINWNDLVKFDIKTLGTAGGAIDCYVFYDKNCKIVKIKSLYNKNDGMIKIRISNELKESIKKNCPNIEMFSDKL